MQKKLHNVPLQATEIVNHHIQSECIRFKEVGGGRRQGEG